MSDNINLISQKTKGFEHQKKIVKRLRIVSAICLSLLLLMSIILFTLKLGSIQSSLDKEKNSLLTDISRQSSKIVKLLLVSDRLTGISDIILKRPIIEKTILSLTSEMSKDMMIDSLNIKDKEVSLSVASGSLLTLGNFLDRMINKAIDKKSFTKITLGNLVLQEKTGNYLLSIIINLP